MPNLVKNHNLYSSILFLNHFYIPLSLVLGFLHLYACKWPQQLILCMQKPEAAFTLQMGSTRLYCGICTCGGDTNYLHVCVLFEDLSCIHVVQNTIPLVVDKAYIMQYSVF